MIKYSSSEILLFLFSVWIALQKVAVMRKSLMIVATIVICLIFKRSIFNEIKNIPKEIYLAYGTFLSSIIISTLMLGESLKDATDYVGYSMPFVFTWFLARTSMSSKAVLYGFALSLFISSTYGIYDFIEFDRNRLEGFYGHPGFYGMMMPMVLPITLIYYIDNYKNINSNFMKSYIWITIVLGIITLFLSGTRGAILGVIFASFISILVYFIKTVEKQKLARVIMVSVIAVCVALGTLYSLNGNRFSRSYDNERLLLIESSYNMWNDNRLFGVGLMNWQKEYKTKYILPEAKEPELGTPHNMFAYFFSTAGLFGGIGFCVFLLSILKYLLSKISRNNRSCIYALGMLMVFLGVCLHGFVESGLMYKFVFRGFSGILGFTVGFIEKDEKELT